ncbi:thioredoxin family protein [Chitinophaga caseinilytica]|uniref:Thioredoxin family protein n=1 Tax=Chitinophaga caseinilytica TaxID=2267521 RepID=A0ABZ2Z9G6_9BACT
MKRLLLMMAAMIAMGTAQAQHKSLDSIYNPAADARADLKAALQKASVEKKHVLLQIGGNWCIWCRRLYKFVEDHPKLTEEQNKNFVVYHLNYSKENKNLDILKELGYPQRFGFPVLVILDAKGNRLHTQNTGLLESADSYDEKKILEMIRQWGPAAFDPVLYAN